ncbi:Uma2 family endonuclease [Rhodopirellula sp. P2]|uniref:Uma2 family endonuclease n=1 Tax=Rhodopirellula sp. P2 TaxID=2127060 RepID=UPI0023687341|nr:Uma2 family endonuclease [Rhodopirellula sp. P2]WDQ17909.1 Uma2 family endonuclease [Rhodopirellula sp. P2]
MSETAQETSSRYVHDIVPQLNSGDVLSHDEYLRRYEAAPEKLKAERINGRVYLMNALRATTHGDPHSILNFWLSTYAMHAPNLVVSDNATVFLGSDHEPQPDLCMRQQVGGSTHLNHEGYLVGPPELIVEIAGSSASYDFGEKREVYEAAGVGEYLIFETLEGRIEWWHHDGNQFIAAPRDADVFKGVTFPGLWLDGDAFRAGDRFRLTETLQRGIQSV